MLAGIIGFVLGANFELVAAGLLHAAKQADDRHPQEKDAKKPPKP